MDDRTRALQAQVAGLLPVISMSQDGDQSGGWRHRSDDEAWLARHGADKPTESSEGSDGPVKWADENKWAAFGRDVAAGHRRMRAPEGQDLPDLCSCGETDSACRTRRLLRQYGLTC